MPATADRLELRARRKDWRAARADWRAARAEVDRARDAHEATTYGTPAYERTRYDLNVALSQRREKYEALKFADLSLLRVQGVIS